ncbi:MAG: DUF2094 domain-containing protein [Desulfuromonadales bacterium]|nr:DUF2094 domain-containing protein [Desulfuromonadales bacterium]
MMSPENQWLWAAHGKHPSAKDFFSIGRKFPLLSDFSEWIKKGYPPLAERGKQAVTGYSWRFWARGGARDELACGLLRDSHDSFGRPYPLLVMGTGRLPSWEDHWEMLPSVCERVWQRLELVSARGFGALGGFEEELGKIRPPDPTWSGSESAAIGSSGETSASSLSVPIRENLARQARNVCAREMGSIIFGNGDTNDSHPLILHITGALKSHYPKAPTTLFIGGTNYESSLFFFRRPMRPSDLLTLWGVHSGA